MVRKLCITRYLLIAKFYYTIVANKNKAKKLDTDDKLPLTTPLNV